LLALSRQLCTRIVNAIERDGPLPFDRYMSMALYEPGLGYYVNGLHKFGPTGDFVTAPEQGRIFARTLARQIAEVASALDSEWTLLELGAGSGALAGNLLEAMECPPKRYLILEPSAALREIQAERLGELSDDLRERIEWISQPPSSPFEGVIVANEVMDALPVACFEITENGPVERCVGIENERFVWAQTPPSRRLSKAIETLQNDLPEPLAVGYQSEICLDLPGWIGTITDCLSRGVALLIDYGYPRSEFYHRDRSGGTLVCHYRHRAHFDPFVWPGLTDLSAFVDFTAVAEAAADHQLDVAGFTSQSGFLLSLGIQDFLEQVDDTREHMRLAGEIKRLVLPAEMGEKFKVIALSRALDDPLRGFTMSEQLGRL